MGNYSCMADNGFPAPAQQIATLVVNCAPRLTGGAFSNNPILTSSGLTFTLLSYPEPDSFSYSYLGNSGNDALASGDYSALFKVTCNKVALLDPLVTCQINPTEKKYVRSGFYRLSVGNGFGNYEFLFFNQQGVDFIFVCTICSDSYNIRYI
ncbi:uncharacterized protein LOC112568173 [Pomacea canaliculata]|uniref:uncharacterized protein LOC112568173 n=1 Tax=Pomacea canaliculata TaxID=400727 RepID=UPI000D7392BA|nr:uncharacterized protein LOC112568173 [Pomacea canaliculata]